MRSLFGLGTVPAPLIAGRNRPTIFQAGGRRALYVVVLAFALTSCFFRNNEVTTGESAWPATSGLGRVATAAEIATLDIDVRPDGQGLPPGSGTVREGQLLYQQKCARCHGRTGVEGPYSALVSIPSDTTRKGKQEKTVGNYWPYASTLYDYIRRAMPYDSSGSLTPEQVYSLTAFLLHANDIIDSTTVLTNQNLPQVVMPAREMFVTDDRKGGPEIR
ncbi:c-type cytochrome [Parachryseolinea silvisoli]|uniref:c-type cytochrome n=1 Tax=Parachryseolinea silvisoli TaxID=2873601 RepID=UPI0022658AF1|nr:cytochrome c [Parachryseolinea silvisoli]MCD9014109.1 cytochrome c [Parachryseolinea silvisoli]